MTGAEPSDEETKRKLAFVCAALQWISEQELDAGQATRLRAAVALYQHACDLLVDCN